jgi:hypothetical protein
MWEVGGVGALASALAEQAAFPQPIQQQPQQPLGLAVGEQPRAELGQHRGVKARIVQVKAQRVLPVQSCSHRVGGLPVGEALDELPAPAPAPAGPVTTLDDPVPRTARRTARR